MRKYTTEQKKHKYEVAKVWRAKNKTRILKRRNELAKLNRSENTKREKEWWIKNKDKVNERRRKYFSAIENKAKRKEYQAQHKKKLSKKVFDQYGNKCACCGEDNPLFLEFDHVFNDGKLERTKRTKTGRMKYDKRAALAKSLVTPKRYQILCSNCNRGKSRNGGVCPHKDVKDILDD